MNKLTYIMLIVMSLHISACTELASTDNNNVSQDLSQDPSQHFSQDQLLEQYIGELMVEHAKTMSYQSNGIGLHGAKFNGLFMEVFDEKAQYLDEEHRADYFITGLWMIPLQGGLISMFADTVAIKDCDNKYLSKKIEDFLADEELGKDYQKGQYRLVRDVYDTIHTTCHVNKKEKS